MELGKIEHGFYLQGDLKFAVDAADAHKTFDAVAALTNADKIKLAQLNGIKAEPFNKNLLTTVLKSVVQNAWFAAKLGTTPSEVLTGHNARVTKYNAELSTPTSSVDFLSRKSRATSTARPSLMFVIDQSLFDADFANWRGQRYLVGNAMIQAGAFGTTGITVRTLFDSIKETRETTRPTRNAVGQIVNALVAAKIATCLNPQDAKAAPTSKPKTPAVGTPSAPSAPSPKTPAPAPNKKKH